MRTVFNTAQSTFSPKRTETSTRQYTTMAATSLAKSGVSGTSSKNESMNSTQVGSSCQGTSQGTTSGPSGSSTSHSTARTSSAHVSTLRNTFQASSNRDSSSRIINPDSDVCSTERSTLSSGVSTCISISTNLQSNTTKSTTTGSVSTLAKESVIGNWIQSSGIYDSSGPSLSSHIGTADSDQITTFTESSPTSRSGVDSTWSVSTVGSGMSSHSGTLTISSPLR